MLHRAVLLFILLTLAPAAIAAPPAPDAAEIAKLIEQLGSPDFPTREAATRRLGEIGAPAVEALRAATISEDPEVVRRAAEVLRKVNRRLANEKALAPTLVELDARDLPLESLLAELSKQSRYDVVLGGLNPEELAVRRVTLATGGPVPFWSAVLKVCDAADLQIAVVGGFLAPGAMPYLGRPKAGLRVVRNTNRAVVLEARDAKAPRRPAAVQGAVLIEAVPFPKGTSAREGHTAVLQAWPEPRMQWQAVSGIKVVKAADDRGRRLRGEYVAAQPAEKRTGPTGRDHVTILRNADGTFTAVRGPSDAFTPNGLFVPNPLQAVLRFSGEAAPDVVKDLEIVLSAAVRSEIKALSLAEVQENRSITGTGRDEVVLSTFCQTPPDGKRVADLKLTYDSKSVQPAGLNDDLPGAKGAAGLGFGNHTVHGVRVTDKNGRPFDLGVRGGSNRLEPDGRTSMTLTLEVVPDRTNPEPPASITFWGTHIQVIEVAVKLTQVRLSGGP